MRTIRMFRWRGGLGLAGVLAALWVSAGPAWAHVHSVHREQLPGRLGTLALRVPHGCGESPTVRLDVAVPEGIEEVRPLPHEGWQLDTVADAAGRITQVSWAGGPLASHDETDFEMQVRFPDRPGTRMWFKAVQSCEQGVTRWVEVPAQGQPVEGLAHPAAFVDLVGQGTSGAERAVAEANVVPFGAMAGIGLLAGIVYLAVGPGRRRS